MATVQVQRVCSPKVITKTTIDQKQSLEVVQTLLHGGLSSLSYLRCFFPEKAFDEQLYEMSDTIHPYKDYSVGGLAKSRAEASSPATVMRVLRRNRSRRVDIFLDWLENGAFAALRDGKLRALQVYVHADATDREKVLETYTFSIQYEENVDCGPILAGLDMDRPGSSQVSVQAANSSLQTLLRQIMELCSELPDLPDERFVSMALFYVNEERTYQPRGFLPSPSDRLLFLQGQGWDRRITTFQKLHSRFHSSTLRVSSLQCTSGSNASAFVTPAVPASLKYSLVASRQGEIDVDPESSDAIDPPCPLAYFTTPSTVTETDRKPTRASTHNVGAPQTDSICQRAASSEPSTNMASGQGTLSDCTPHDAQRATILECTASPILGKCADTQTSSVLDMKNAFQNMMQPEVITQGDTQPQTEPRRVSLRKGPFASLKSSSKLPPEKTTFSPPVEVSKPALSQYKANKMLRNRDHLQSNAFKLVKTQSPETTSGDIILCQCDSTNEEGDMVKCFVCGTWQHLTCYGYTGEDDPRVPDDHACYQCLLGDGASSTLNEVQKLARNRRGMGFALQYGLKGQREFAEDLGVSLREAGLVFNYLKKEGYIAEAKNSHQAGYKASGKPLFVAVKDGPNHERMLNNLFDPLLHVAHHYRLPEQPTTQYDALTQRLFASQSNDMPPPATPALKLRDKNAVTPGSCLDVRASMTPFRTPSRSRIRQTPSRKRIREHADPDETLLKRSATARTANRRLRSVQSVSVIDAGGMSSSPARAWPGL